MSSPTVTVPTVPVRFSSVSVPAELQAIPNWVCWKYELHDDKYTKVPFDPKNDRNAKSNDPSTWGTFENVAERLCVILGNDEYRRSGGAGFMLKGTNLVGIDFDGVRSETGEVEPYIADILLKLGNPYCEITPSGNGLRVFVECAQLPRGQRKFSDGHHYGAEIYIGSEGGRYLTVTGNRYCGEGVPKIDDISLVYFMISQVQNPKFRKLWLGDISDYGDDHSRADMALCAILARKLKCDREKIEKFFSSSVLGQRDKWIDREDYRNRTIQRVLEGKATPDPVDDPRLERETGGSSKSEPLVGVFLKASSIRPERIKWLWNEKIPLGKLTLFAGDPDNGKSLATENVVSYCTRGKPFPMVTNSLPPSEVLMFVGEDDLKDTAVPRLIAANADMDKVEFFEAIRLPSAGEVEIVLDKHLGVLEDKLQACPNIRLIVIDPISNYIGANMHGEQEVRQKVLTPLKNLAAQRNVAIILVMHLNKKSELQAINRVGGAMAFVGVCRCSWLFKRDQNEDGGDIKDSFTMSRIKNNIAKPSDSGIAYTVKAKKLPELQVDGEEDIWTPYIEWGGVVQKSADDALVAKRGAGRPKGSDLKKQTAVRLLGELLRDGAKPAKWIAEQAKGLEGLSSDTLNAASKEMHIKKTQVKNDQGKNEWTWALQPIVATAPEFNSAGVSVDGEPL